MPRSSTISNIAQAPGGFKAKKMRPPGICAHLFQQKHHCGLSVPYLCLPSGLAGVKLFRVFRVPNFLCKPSQKLKRLRTRAAAPRRLCPQFAYEILPYLGDSTGLVHLAKSACHPASMSQTPPKSLKILGNSNTSLLKAFLSEFSWLALGANLHQKIY